ncbi:helix-turn-helix domain-containing protein [Prescottella equi]|uniref:helix-turn-helix domain-containing protein n=1 Tax=Rhodococcus hoagii TaxID=43767 RepID=UPI0007CD482D|nr:helix-turn-helix transcriptional regulator [Prescottella equi]
MSNWSDFLRARLDDRGWDAARLAAEAGVTPSIVSRWMSGAHKPTADRVRAVAEALDVSVMEAMIAAEVITADEAKVTALAPDPKLLSDQELLGEMSRRLAERQVVEKAGDVGRRLTSVRRTSRQPLKTRRASGEQLAAQEGETEARKRKRLERQPEDFPDPDGPEDGA